MIQDNFYLKEESNAFFDRWKENLAKEFPIELRSSKREILGHLTTNVKLEKLKVLEVGCFIGDLLSQLRNDYQCEVYGIEPSSKACDYAHKNFDLLLENSTFIKSTYFQLTEKNIQLFDLIILDDVLSWMSRDFILPSLGVLDWMLKPGGSIYIRDFSPVFAFAFQNHHCPSEKVFNYKQQGGHKKFLLESGKYLEQSSNLRNTSDYQKVTTSRPDASVWSDTILVKLHEPLHPILDL